MDIILFLSFSLKRRIHVHEISINYGLLHDLLEDTYAFSRNALC